MPPSSSSSSSPLSLSSSSSPSPSSSSSSSLSSSLSSSGKLTLVFKIGSSSITDPTPPSGVVRLSVMTRLVEMACTLNRHHHRVLLVSSGAVSMGMQRLPHVSVHRPTSLSLVVKQAVAAVGQCRLMSLWDTLFAQFNQPIAQVLLTRDNINDKSHYTNALNTLNTLLDMKVIPIINENDCVSVAELRFGDNDTLSALVASLVSASHLFLLTDVDALYTSNPRTCPDAQPIHLVHNIDATLSHVKVDEGAGTHIGTGGMITKLNAARIATSAGCHCSIVNSEKLEHVLKLLTGDRDVATTFTASPAPIRLSHKRWIAHFQKPQGVLELNEGAARAISKHKSLFAAGIVNVQGEFLAQSTVSLVCRGEEIARAMIAYDSRELVQIIGKKSSQFHEVLNYNGPAEIAHRDSIALLSQRDDTVVDSE